MYWEILSLEHRSRVALGKELGGGEELKRDDKNKISKSPSKRPLTVGGMSHVPLAQAWRANPVEARELPRKRICRTAATVFPIPCAMHIVLWSTKLPLANLRVEGWVCGPGGVPPGRS